MCTGETVGNTSESCPVAGIALGGGGPAAGSPVMEWTPGLSLQGPSKGRTPADPGCTVNGTGSLFSLRLTTEARLLLQLWALVLLPITVAFYLISSGLNYTISEKCLLPSILKELLKVNVSVSQSCLTLCDPMDCSPPDFSVHRILQARILEWVAVSFSRGSS